MHSSVTVEFYQWEKKLKGLRCIRPLRVNAPRKHEAIYPCSILSVSHIYSGHDHHSHANGIPIQAFRPSLSRPSPKVLAASPSLPNILPDGAHDLLHVQDLHVILSTWQRLSATDFTQLSQPLCVSPKIREIPPHLQSKNRSQRHGTKPVSSFRSSPVDHDTKRMRFPPTAF